MYISDDDSYGGDGDDYDEWWVGGVWVMDDTNFPPSPKGRED